MKTVNCRYLEDCVGRTYSFMTQLNEVKAGDRMIVESSNGLGIVEVVSVDESSSPRATRWAFQFVDELSLSSLQAASKRVREIKAKMAEKAKRLDERAKYVAMAQTDEEMKALLAALDSTMALFDLEGS